MTQINLLPHREEKRKARRQQFYTLLVMVSILAGLIVFGVYTTIDGYIQNQEEKNSFLKKEIAVLDKQIEEIKSLKDKTQALLARKQIIESLQRDRSEAVLLLSELVKLVPEGIYIRSIIQKGVVISLSGYAQSSARVSTLMRNIETSPWLEKPVLIQVQAVTVDKRRLNDFNLNAALKRAPVENGGKK